MPNMSHEEQLQPELSQNPQQPQKQQQELQQQQQQQQQPSNMVNVTSASTKLKRFVGKYKKFNHSKNFFFQFDFSNFPTMIKQAHDTIEVINVNELL